MLKRQRERERIEKQKQKMARRLEKSQRERPKAADSDGDPDIAHIVPGPQPLADWQVDEEPAKDDEAAGEEEDAK